MKAIWILPICLLIIGFFGMFWIIQLSDVKIDVNFNMDNNSLEAIKQANQIQERQMQSDCHTIIYEYDLINNTFHQVSDLDFEIRFIGYDNDILRIGNTDYKFETICR